MMVPNGVRYRGVPRKAGREMAGGGGAEALPRFKLMLLVYVYKQLPQKDVQNLEKQAEEKKKAFRLYISSVTHTVSKCSFEK